MSPYLIHGWRLSVWRLPTVLQQGDWSLAPLAGSAPIWYVIAWVGIGWWLEWRGRCSSAAVGWPSRHLRLFTLWVVGEAGLRALGRRPWLVGVTSTRSGSCDLGVGLLPWPLWRCGSWWLACCVGLRQASRRPSCAQIQGYFCMGESLAWLSQCRWWWHFGAPCPSWRCRCGFSPLCVLQVKTFNLFQIEPWRRSSGVIFSKASSLESTVLLPSGGGVLALAVMFRSCWVWCVVVCVVSVMWNAPRRRLEFWAELLPVEYGKSHRRGAGGPLQSWEVMAGWHL